MWIPQMALLLGFALLTFQFAIIIADRYAEVFGKGAAGEEKKTC